MTEVQVNKPKKVPLVWKLTVGAAAGFIGTCCIYPIDIVKTRLQVDAKLYSGPIDCTKRLIRTGGVLSFYSGLPINLIGVLPEKAIKLAANEFFRESFEGPDGSIKLYQEVLAGGMAGFCQVIATNPMELVKIRLQLQATLPKENRKSTVAIIRELGLSGVYRGTCSTLLRDVPFSFIFFPLYANISSLLANEEGKTGFYSQLVSGCVAGGIGAGCVTPCDVVKTRLQMVGGKEKYGNIMGVFRTVLREEGATAFFKGLLPRVAVSELAKFLVMFTIPTGIAFWFSNAYSKTDDEKIAELVKTNTFKVKDIESRNSRMQNHFNKLKNSDPELDKTVAGLLWRVKESNEDEKAEEPQENDKSQDAT